MDLTARPDVVIVGSGAGGAAVAWRLTSLGLNVRLLEAGPWFDPQTDYPLDSADWERHRFPVKPGSQATISYGDLGVLEPDFQDLRARHLNPIRPTPPLGTPRRPSPLGYAHVQGVGGSTLHYVGEAHRLHPDAFRSRTLTGEGADWPVTYADLEPYYTIAETQIGVAGEGEPQGRWRSSDFPMSPHPHSNGAKELLAAGAGIGQIWETNPRAANSRPYDFRPECNYCGQCSRGCPIGDKGSADVTFIRKALATGRLDLLDRAVVTKLNSGAAGQISSVVFVRDGIAHQLETPHLILAGGAVQSPRLLLLARSSDQPDGLANGSGLLGRNFMETLFIRGAGLVEGLSNNHMGLPSDVTCWDKTAPVASGEGGYKMTHTTLDIGLNGPAAFAARMVSGFGPSLKRDLRKHFGSALAVSAIGQVVSDERSYVDTDPERTDDLGLPVARIHSVLTEGSLARLRAMKQDVTTVLEAAGTNIVEEDNSWNLFQATHVFGTAQMGQDSSTSVVDPYGQSHDHPNLWILDASIFPTSGGGEAPSLTIMALAIRGADKLAGHLLK